MLSKAGADEELYLYENNYYNAIKVSSKQGNIKVIKKYWAASIPSTILNQSVFKIAFLLYY